MGFKSIVNLIKQTVAEWQRDDAPKQAAALAFYTILSLAPLLVVVVGIAGLIFGNQQAQEALVSEVARLSSPQVAETIRGLIASGGFQKESMLATIIGAVMLVLGALGVFGQLRQMLNTIWDVTPEHKGLMRLITGRLFSFLMVLAIGFLLLVLVGLSTAIGALDQYLEGAPVWVHIATQIVDLMVSIGILTVLLAMIYKVLPDSKIPWKDVWTGSFVTALLFALGKYLLGLYLGRATVGSAFGAAASLFVLLLWIYYSAQILFLGAELTHMLAQRKHGQA